MKRTKLHLELGLLFFCLVALHFGVEPAADGQDPFELPHLMYQDPRFVEVQTEIIFSEKLLPLWSRALNSETVELRRKAAETILIAKRRGMRDFSAIVQPLEQRLESGEESTLVRLAIAKALIAIGNESSWEKLAKLLPSNDVQLHLVIEPALTLNRPDALRSIWEERLDSPLDERRTLVTMAIDGLAAAGEKEAIEPIGQLLRDPNAPYSIRLSAARAIGRLAEDGFQDFARTRVESDQVTERLLAVHAIKGHAREIANPVLLRYAVDPEPAVATQAWHDLLDSEDSRELDPHIEHATENRDPKIRLQGLALIQRWRNQDAVVRAGRLLNDPHPDVRNRARLVCREFADVAELKGDVLDAGMRALLTDWQGIQQGLLLLAELKHAPAVEICVDLLLDHPRPEVHITAAWLLERLSVEKTLDPILKRLEKQISDVKSGGSTRYSESQYEAMGHLIQLLGKNRVKQMKKIIIEKLIAKDMAILSYPIRPAAIWSVGKLYEGQELPETYRTRLLERLLDEDPMNPEHENVKSMVAVTFALTGEESTVEFLQRYADKSRPNSRLSFSCRWALNKLVGEPIPKIEPLSRPETDWFLVPIE